MTKSEKFLEDEMREIVKFKQFEPNGMENCNGVLTIQARAKEVLRKAKRFRKKK